MTTPRRSRSTASPGLPSWVLGAAGVATLLVLLELLPLLGIVDPRFLPPVSQMFALW